jgi:hypothetical protein
MRADTILICGDAGDGEPSTRSWLGQARSLRALVRIVVVGGILMFGISVLFPSTEPRVPLPSSETATINHNATALPNPLDNLFEWEGGANTGALVPATTPGMDTLWSSASRIARLALTGAATLWLFLESDAYLGVLGVSYAEEVVLWGLVRVSGGDWLSIQDWADSASLDVQLAGTLVAFALWHLALADHRDRGDGGHDHGVVSSLSLAISGVSGGQLLYVAAVTAAVITGASMRSTGAVKGSTDIFVHLGVGLVSGARRSANMHLDLRLRVREIGGAPLYRRAFMRVWSLDPGGGLEIMRQWRAR